MIGKSAVDKARGVVVEFEQTVARWEADATTKRAELEDLELRAGDEVLADETAADRLTEDMARLRSGIEIAGRAAGAAGRKLEDARRALLRARAVEMRERAATMRATADKRQQRTDKLLAELADFEGVAFGPRRQYSSLGTDVHGVEPYTRTDGIRHHADALETSAAQLDQQAETAAGEDLEALVRALPDAERAAQDVSV